MLSLYYVPHFDTLVAYDHAFKAVKEHENVNDDITLIFDEQGKVTGFNIFNFASKTKNKLVNGKWLYNKKKGIEEVNALLEKLLPKGKYKFVGTNENKCVYEPEFITVKVISWVEVKDSILKHVTVTDGKNEYKLITNTTNLVEGMVTVMALTYATLFDGTVIAADTKMKGIESKFMFCGQDTLNVEGYNETGIIVLPTSTELGIDVAKSELSKKVKI